MKSNVFICPPCGESVAQATKEGQNKNKALWPLLPRLTAVLPPQGREMSFGFTLIELLVVVLIIGVLAAVAVPQYQLAVNKTRFAKLHSLAATYSRAARIYYELHGEYPKEISKMDVDFPAGMTSYTGDTLTCAYNTEFYCCVNEDSSAVGASVTCGLQDYSFAIRLTKTGQYCIANQNDNNALHLCRVLGQQPVDWPSTMWPYPGGYRSGQVYRLTN